MSEDDKWQGLNRRKTAPEHDKLMQVIMASNIVVWLLFVVALVIFHYARPELITGVQKYWGITGRENWSETLSWYLFGVLAVCVIMTAATLVMKRIRARRKQDGFGLNLLFLFVVTLISCVAIFMEIT